MTDLDLGSLEQFFIKETDITLEAEIGKGGFSVVYKGRLNNDNREVAIKKVSVPKNDKEQLKFLRREIQVQCDLRHPSIVEFYGICVVEGTKGGVWLVTEFAPNRNLRKWLKASEIVLPWKLRVRWALDTAQAMVYVHSKGLIHRDLKSTNLLMDASFHIKLADFGFARQAEKSARPMTMCGTDDWMAPEVALGTTYGGPADVFSFGIILVEVITRLRPAHERLRRTPMNMFCLPVDDFRALANEGCPSDFVELAIKCTEYHPEARPDFAEVADVLSEIFRSLPDDLGWEKPSLLNRLVQGDVFTPQKRVLSPVLSEVAALATSFRSEQESDDEPDLTTAELTGMIA